MDKLNCDLFLLLNSSSNFDFPNSNISVTGSNKTTDSKRTQVTTNEPR